MRILSFLFLLMLSISVRAELSYPKLFFSRGWLLDNWCAETIPDYKIDPAWVKDLRDISPRLIALWEQDASNLFQVLFDDFGKGFSRKKN